MLRKNLLVIVIVKQSAKINSLKPVFYTAAVSLRVVMRLSRIIYFSIFLQHLLCGAYIYVLALPAIFKSPTKNDKTALTTRQRSRDKDNEGGWPDVTCHRTMHMLKRSACNCI